MSPTTIGTSFQEAARSNQRARSLKDGSSNLTRVDVRTQIAIEAGVATGNVTKYEQLMKTAHPKVQRAAQAGEISLHRAWQWSHLSAETQLKELETCLSQRGAKKAIRRLIRGHVAKRSPSPPPRPSLGDILRRLSTHEFGELDSISVGVIKGAGRFVFLTEEALRMLRSLEN